MDIRPLQLFLSVADTLNFSRSAEHLHVSLSAVSRGIARLEASVGEALMERDNRRVVLTPAGREFRQYAVQAVDEWRRLQRRLGTVDQLAGELSLYCSVTASYSLLAPVLEGLREQYPAIEIKLHTGDPADAIERVLSGQEDVAVTGRPQRLPPRLDFLPLHTSALRLIAPAGECNVRDMLDDGDTCDSAFDWSRIPFIVPERGPTQESIEDWFASMDIRPVIYARVAGHEAIVAMVSLGLGVGFAPDLVIQTSGLADRVSSPLVQRQPAPLPIGLCTLARRRENDLISSLWQVAQASYSPAL